MRSDRPNRLLPLGIAIFAIGLVAIAALFVTPLVADGATAPTFVYVLAMGTPVGLVLALIATFLNGRTSGSETK